MPGPLVLTPGRIVHIVRERSTRCYAAMLLNAPNPQVATLRNMEDDAVTRATPHSTAENNSMVTWHTVEECRATWPTLGGPQREQR